MVCSYWMIEEGYKRLAYRDSVRRMYTYGGAREEECFSSSKFSAMKILNVSELYEEINYFRDKSFRKENPKFLHLGLDWRQLNIVSDYFKNLVSRPIDRQISIKLFSSLGM